MLRVAVTGTAGAGKSTAVRRMAELGATVARSGETCDVTDFGARPRGRDRVPQPTTAMAQALADDFTDSRPECIVVDDDPLPIQTAAHCAYHCVVFVDTPLEERIRQLSRSPASAGCAERAAVAAAVHDHPGKAIADVMLENIGSREDLTASVDALWVNRLLPYESNVRANRMALYGSPSLVAPDPTWRAQADRLAGRIRLAAGPRATRVDHIGSTAVPSLPAKDVIDLQLTVTTLEDAGAMSYDLAAAGFLLHPGIDSNPPHGSIRDPAQWRKRYFKSSDPARPANLHVRVAGTAGWRFALLFRDWLRADPQIREEYLSVKRDLVHRFGADHDTARYGLSKDPWFASAYPRMEDWADRHSWHEPDIS